MNKREMNPQNHCVKLGKRTRTVTFTVRLLCKLLAFKKLLGNADVSATVLFSIQLTGEVLIRLSECIFDIH